MLNDILGQAHTSGVVVNFVIFVFTVTTIVRLIRPSVGQCKSTL